MNQSDLHVKNRPYIFSDRTYALSAGISYFFIFILAIYANFSVLETLLHEPVITVQEKQTLLKSGILAFLFTVVFDVIVTWSLYELFKHHPLSLLSALFRMMHAVIMGIAIFALPPVLRMDNGADIISQVESFNTIWLLGLFFFGIHIILLGKILPQPVFIKVFLVIAGVMYMTDTVAHFSFSDYAEYADTFLMLVAIPSVLGELSLTLWLLRKGVKALHPDA